MFKEKFIELLQSKKIKPYHVAKATGISPGLMSEYKNGIKTPTIENLIKISNYLDCSIDYLLGRTDNPNVNGNNISNIDTTINGTQANIINNNENDLDEIKSILSKLPSAKNTEQLLICWTY